MFWIVVPIAMLISVVLIVMVLLQPSKSGGMGGAFGQLGSTLGSTFGSRRTLDFLAKGTTWMAAGLGLLCILANWALSSGVGTSAPTGQATPVTTGAKGDPRAIATPPAPAPGAKPGAAAPGTPAPGTPAPGAAQQSPGATPQSANVQSRPVEVQEHPANVTVKRVNPADAKPPATAPHK